MGVPFNAGWRFAYDQLNRFQGTGLPAWLIVKKFADDNPVTGQAEDFIELGVPVVATGGDGGVYLIPIDPPCSAQELSAHTIGVFGGRLNFGSMKVLVSHTFVESQMLQYQIVDNVGVWRDRDGKKAVGILYNNRLYSIEGITSTAVSNQPFIWTLICNALMEQQVQL